MWREGAPVVPIVFYRALVQGAGLHPVNRLTRSLLRRGLNPLPVFVASLKDPVSQATLETIFTEAPPAIILNATAFATGNGRDESAFNPLASPAANQAPVFQIVLAASSVEDWESGQRGLTGRDIAMNVALPEIDGRILSRAISFKGEAYFDEATECPIATYRARDDRVEFVSDLAKNWVTLRAHASRKAPCGAGARELSQQGRAARQWRGARYARRHRSCAAGNGESGLSSL